MEIEGLKDGDAVTLAGPLAEAGLAALLCPGGTEPLPALPGGALGGGKSGLGGPWPRRTAVGAGVPACLGAWNPDLARYARATGLTPASDGGAVILGVTSASPGPAADDGDHPSSDGTERDGAWALTAALRFETARRLLAMPADTPPALLARRALRIATWVDSQQRGAHRVAQPLSGPAPGENAQPAYSSALMGEPYADYFSVESHRFVHRLHRGGWSGPVQRGVFVSGDAVVVLPWDPVRDRVLVVDQFRAGPAARRDPNPWVLEPIAGRIDPGETPESTALREAQEEAGLPITSLIPAPAHYPSPGMAAEYLYAFIGLADLPDTAAIVSGLEVEQEDIRGRLLARSELTALALGGQLTSGPLILVALWLDRQAEALKAQL